ncbi:MAG TPA: ATP-binding cassette domain-containing protein, partial [Bacillota bacterium]|nr:ATP-binding cassette domain-containing protein [Bacillota bacterium]
MAILKTENLTRRFGGLVAVNNLSFEIPEGKITGLIGPNGSGKSTTINLISGVLPASSGSVEYMGKKITGFAPHMVARMGISRTYQQIR